MAYDRDMSPALNVLQQQKNKYQNRSKRQTWKKYINSQTFHFKHYTMIVQVEMWGKDSNSKEYPTILWTLTNALHIVNIIYIIIYVIYRYGHR